MRKNHKRAAILASGALVLGSTGVAYAYWTTTGSGTGDGATTTGSVDELSFDQAPLNDMYPGDSEQTLTVTVTNDSVTQSAYITSVVAYLTVTGDCSSSDFLLNGAPAPDETGTPVTMTWTAQELDANGGSDDATSTVQFNNKSATNQDGCKDADVKIHYAVPAVP